MATFSSVTTFTVVTAILLLASPRSYAKSIPDETRSLPAHTQEKLQALRKLSIEAGLPQVETHQGDVCYTDGCIDAAFDILSAMDNKVDPCDDFFKYSCGRWLASNPVPPSQSRWSRFNRLRDEVNSLTQEILNEPENNTDAAPINLVKQFYRGCMDEAAIDTVGLQPLKDLIADLGGWQILDPAAWDEDDFDWVEAVAKVRRITLSSALLQVYVSADIKNTSQHVVYIDQPGLGLPRGMLIDRANYGKQFEAYETYIFEVARELGPTPGRPDPDLRAAAKAIVDFEESFAMKTRSDEERYDMNSVYHPKKLNEFQSETDQEDEDFKIDWMKLLNEAFSTSDGINIGNQENLIVSEVEYVKALIPILKAAENKQNFPMHNYIVWRAVSTMVTSTTTKMREIAFKFQKELTGASEQQERKMICANAANDGFGFAIGVKYVEKAFSESAKGEMNEMVDNLLTAFVGMVQEADWMENATKDAAILKRSTIETLMAYPDWLKDKVAVEKFYEDMTLGVNHWENQLNIAKYRLLKSFKALRTEPQKDEWFFYPGVVNAAYSPEANSISFPAGILQPPFFGGDRPKHQNYGGIGVVIGHEITHGFDNQGAQFDELGNANNWWDAVTKAKFEDRSKCMSDQYSEHCYTFQNPERRVCVNGDLTLGENIADNGGLRESLRAYRKFSEDHGAELKLPGLESLNVNQLFFLGYANIWCENINEAGLENQLLTDPHSPAEWRVNGVAINSVDFSDVSAFNCSATARMNPPEKCTVW